MSELFDFKEFLAARFYISTDKNINNDRNVLMRQFFDYININKYILACSLDRFIAYIHSFIYICRYK